MNPQNDEDIQRFWQHCTNMDIVTKPLAIVSRSQSTAKVSPIGASRHFLPGCAPIALVTSTAMKYGSPIISVPYQQVLNVQNLRGGLRPATTPPFVWWMRCLSRLQLRSPVKKHIPNITAQSLWLASCLADFRHALSAPPARKSRASEMGVRDSAGRVAAETTHVYPPGMTAPEPLPPSSSSPPSSSFPPWDLETCGRGSGAAAPYPWYDAIAPLLSPTLQYTLDSPFVPSNAVHYPALCGLSPAGLEEARRWTDHYIHTLYRVKRYYAKRCGIPVQLLPTKTALTTAYYTVLYRSMLLPINGTPSAPGDLSDLFEAMAPDLLLLPSLIPVIDLIRPLSITSTTPDWTAAAEKSTRVPPPLSAGREGGAGGEESAAAVAQEKVKEQENERPNCTLHTCQQADFFSPSSRRRLVLPPTSSVFSNRRVVVCAARDILAGEELTLGF